MRVNHRQRAHIFMLAGVFGLMVVTLYMAFAFPFTLLHLKQSETSELKAVILVGRHGEVTPPRDVYFETFGEEPPEEWFTLGGANQLTNIGKERMYLLGKFLRLRYHDKLLGGNPRRLLVRADNSDKSLESAQALLAGLNPPTSSQWKWQAQAGATCSSSSSGGECDELARLWQPKAVHTTSEQLDDLLSSRPRCLVMDSLRAHWKNSTRYAHLLNEFRHDLQILRQNTGLEFEDDLEMLADIEDQLKARASLALESPMGPPSWYTETFASRMAHVADATSGCRFSQVGTQRLFVGRLLDAITKNIFGKIRSDLTSGLSLLGDGESDETDAAAAGGEQGGDQNDPTFIDFNKTRSATGIGRAASTKSRQEEIQLIRKNKLLPPEERARLKLAHLSEPSMFVYMTDKHHLTALLNSLKIYSSQPHFGSLLIIELHYDAANQMHFLRLFAVNSLSHNVLPEPVRVNPIACLDSVECSPQQFEKNIRHLRLDKLSWQQACQAAEDSISTTTLPPESDLDLGGQTDATTPETILQPATQASNGQHSKVDKLEPTDRSDAVTLTTNRPATATTTTTTMTKDTLSSDSPPPTMTESTGAGSADKLDEGDLLVGPTNTSRPISSVHLQPAANKTKPDEAGEHATAIPSTLVEVDKTATEPEPLVTENSSSIVVSLDPNGSELVAAVTLVSVNTSDRTDATTMQPSSSEMTIQEANQTSKVAEKGRPELADSHLESIF